MAVSTKLGRPGSYAMLIGNPEEFNRTFDATLVSGPAAVKSWPEFNPDAKKMWPKWDADAKGASSEDWAKEVLTSIDPAHVSDLLARPFDKVGAELTKALRFPGTTSSTAATGSLPEKATTVADLIEARDKVHGRKASMIIVDELADLERREKEGERAWAKEKKEREAAARAETRKWRLASLEHVAETMPERLPRDMTLRMKRFGDVDAATIEIGLTDTLHRLEFRRGALGYGDHAGYRDEMERLARCWSQDLHIELQARVRQISGLAAIEASDPCDKLPDGLEELLAEEAERSFGSAARGTW